MNETAQILNCSKIRDEKVFNLTLLGWSKTRIAEELGMSRTTVSMILNSPYGQERLTELYSHIEQPLMMLPELVGLSLNQLREVLMGKYGGEKSQAITNAAKLVLGVAAKFQELDRTTIRPVQNQF